MLVNKVLWCIKSNDSLINNNFVILLVSSFQKFLFPKPSQKKDIFGVNLEGVHASGLYTRGLVLNIYVLPII